MFITATSSTLQWPRQENWLVLLFIDVLARILYSTLNVHLSACIFLCCSLLFLISIFFIWNWPRPRPSILKKNSTFSLRFYVADQSDILSCLSARITQPRLTPQKAKSKTKRLGSNTGQTNVGSYSKYQLRSYLGKRSYQHWARKWLARCLRKKINLLQRFTFVSANEGYLKSLIAHQMNDRHGIILLVIIKLFTDHKRRGRGQTWCISFSAFPAFCTPQSVTLTRDHSRYCRST